MFKDRIKHNLHLDQQIDISWWNAYDSIEMNDKKICQLNYAFGLNKHEINANAMK